MSELSSAPAPAPAQYTMPGTPTPEAIKERNNLFRQFCDMVGAIPGFVLPKGITLAQVLTAGVDPKSIWLFSDFFWGNLSDEQRAYINGEMTVLFSQQKHAHDNIPKGCCFQWPSGCEQNTTMKNRDGANIIAPNRWLFLSLNNCNCTFYSVGLNDTFFGPWLAAIQGYFLDTSKSPVHTGLPRCNAYVVNH